MMERRVLGGSGFTVSRLCFGVLTMGPLQAHLPLDVGADLLRAAYELGVNFYDTAELYGTYPYLAKVFSGNADVVIATKSYAVTAMEMWRSIEKARLEMGLDRIPIFLLHEQATAASFRGHQQAWEALLEAKARGIVGAVGISTHTVEGVRVATTCPELDVVHPLFNQSGWGISDGNAEDMAEAIATAEQMGKGIYAMKALAGGHLRQEACDAIRFVLDSPGVTAVAIGIQSVEELRVNVRVCEGLKPMTEDLRMTRQVQRRLHVENWCMGCGKCVARCPFGAIVLHEDRAEVRFDQCMVCGYCSQVCPEVALKVL